MTNNVKEPLGEGRAMAKKEASAASSDRNWQQEVEPSRSLARDMSDLMNQFRFNCGMLINNKHIQNFIILLICINGIMMGIGTFDFVKKDEKVNNAFEAVDLTFLIIFTVELGLQVVYHGWRLILDGWLLFDLVIIVTSWSFSSVQIIRAFRIFRALRLVTRIKIMKNLILGKSLQSFLCCRIRYVQNLELTFSFCFFSPLWCDATYGSYWTYASSDFLHLCCDVHAALQRFR